MPPPQILTFDLELSISDLALRVLPLSFLSLTRAFERFRNLLIINTLFLLNNSLNSCPRRSVLFTSSVAAYPFPPLSARSSHILSFSFQSLTNCPIYKPFVLILLQTAGSVEGATLLRSDLWTFLRVLHVSLQICTFVFNHFHDAPPATSFLSCFCIVARGCTSPALRTLRSLGSGSTVHGSTGHESPVTNHARVSRALHQPRVTNYESRILLRHSHFPFSAFHFRQRPPDGFTMLGVRTYRPAEIHLSPKEAP